MSAETWSMVEHARLAGAQVGIVVLLFLAQVRWAKRAAGEALQGLPGAGQAPPLIERAAVAAELQVGDLHLSRINEQLQEIHARARHHLELATLIFRNYYAAILCASLTGLVAGGCLFVISYQGWAKADPVLTNVCLVMSLLSLFYVGFPRLFAQKQNIARNRELYRAAIALLDEYRTWLATARDGEGHEVDAPAFLGHVDHELAGLDCLVLGLDESAVLTPAAVAGRLREGVQAAARRRGGKEGK